MPRYCSTVLIASAGPPIAYAALILLRPRPGMSTTVSRGIESCAFRPPPMRISMIVSARDGPPTEAPGSALPSVRASEPSTRIVFGEVSVKPLSARASLALSATLPLCTPADTRKTSSEMSSQAPPARATNPRILPGPQPAARAALRAAPSPPVAGPSSSRIPPPSPAAEQAAAGER